MNALLGVAAHRSLPEGESIGSVFIHDGKLYCVTQSEIDRIRNLPSADEVRGMVAALEAIIRPTDAV